MDAIVEMDMQGKVKELNQIPTDYPTSINAQMTKPNPNYDAIMPTEAKRGGGKRKETSKCNDVPAHPFDLILARATATSVTVSVLCHRSGKAAPKRLDASGQLTMFHHAAI